MTDRKEVPEGSKGTIRKSRNPGIATYRSFPRDSDQRPRLGYSCHFDYSS